MKIRDTIVAVATAAGRSGIGVVRVSGSSLTQFMEALLGRRLPPRYAALSDFRGAGNELIDQGIAIYFPGPHSYTGEDVLELQGHGGPVLMQLLVKRCLELGARIARPGEFTERAFLNDKLDLAQAEAVADLIDASTAQAARSALRSLQGVFSERITGLDRELIELRTLIEATLDLPDEEVDFLRQADADARLIRVRDQLLAVLAASRQGNLLREGLHVVLAGQPNVGKSSLLNRLAGEDLAIVTAVPGTTRDAVRLSVDLDGVPVHIIDTAGLRDTQDPVERLGIARSWDAIQRADAVVILLDAMTGETAADRAILARLPGNVPCIRVMNKIDLTGRQPALEPGPTGNTTVWLSALTGAGLGLLQEALLAAAGWHGGGEGLYLARHRHVEALGAAKGHVERAMAVGGQLELCAEELRLAHESLASITGEFTHTTCSGKYSAVFASEE